MNVELPLRDYGSESKLIPAFIGQIIDRIDDAAVAFTEAKRRARRYAEQHKGPS